VSDLVRNLHKKNGGERHGVKNDVLLDLSQHPDPISKRRGRGKRETFSSMEMGKEDFSFREGDVYAWVKAEGKLKKHKRKGGEEKKDKRLGARLHPKERKNDAPV